MVGSDYQAAIPEGLCSYDDALPYENEDKLLWDPHPLGQQQIEEFLLRATVSGTGVSALPKGCQLRDDEQALFLLLQCGHNVEEALRRRRINSIPAADTMSLWSEEECRNFENGLRSYGKDFHLIQQNKAIEILLSLTITTEKRAKTAQKDKRNIWKTLNIYLKHLKCLILRKTLTEVRTRSVGELVQFYYLWKKTERHDVFANKARLEKKKYTLHPGLTDFMDRFLEEQEGGRDRSSSPNMQFISGTDTKKPICGMGIGILQSEHTSSEQYPFTPKSLNY